MSVLVLDELGPAGAPRRRGDDEQSGAAVFPAVTQRGETVAIPLIGQQKGEKLRRERRRVGACGASLLVTLARLATVDPLDLPRDSRHQRVVHLDAHL